MWEEGEERRLKIEGKERGEIITVRGQSYVSPTLSSSKILTPHPPLRPASVYPPPLLGGGGGHTRRAERGGGGVNILEDERHRIALLQ